MSLTFEPITMKRQADYRARLAMCGQIASDYSFINIWGWGEEYGLSWAWQNGLVWIRQAKPQPVLWAPVGDWNAADWPRVLGEARTVADTLIRVPQTLAEQLRDSGILPAAPEEMRDHWDYLYSVEELVELKGNRFHKKKNLVNQFKKTYEYAYLAFGQEMIDQALALQEDWCTWRDCESNDTLAAENSAIAKVLNDWRDMGGITGGALIVEGTIAAYTIAETLPDNSMVIHFEKGCPDIKGSYQAINQMFLTNAPGEPEIVNREQDIGDEGLRKAKLSYHPVDFVKKYRIKL